MKKISLATCRGGRGVCFWTASLVSRLVFLRLYCYPTVFTYSDQWLHLYNLYFLFIFYTFFNKLSDSYNDFLQMWCLTICVFRERSNIQIFKYCNVPPTNVQTVPLSDSPAMYLPILLNFLYCTLSLIRKLLQMYWIQ